MPGRQAHGRPLTAAPKSAPKKNSSKARSQKNALNAFGIAQENFASKPKLTPRARELDAQVERKHGREAEEDPASEDDIEDGPQRKKAKSSKGGVGGGEVDYGSDSEGNEWQLGGMAEDDEDSEIESDEAFGDSDNDRFQGYSFRGSSRKEKVHTSGPVWVYANHVANLQSRKEMTKVARTLTRTILMTMKARHSVPTPLTSPRLLINTRALTTK